MGRLSAAMRKALPTSDFAVPGKAPGPGSYPVNDASHARDALSRVAADGDADDRAQVRAKVASKFPQIGQSGGQSRGKGPGPQPFPPARPKGKTKGKLVSRLSPSYR